MRRQIACSEFSVAEPNQSSKDAVAVQMAERSSGNVQVTWSTNRVLGEWTGGVAHDFRQGAHCTLEGGRGDIRSAVVVMVNKLPGSVADEQRRQSFELT